MHVMPSTRHAVGVLRLQHAPQVTQRTCTSERSAGRSHLLRAAPPSLHAHSLSLADASGGACLAPQQPACTHRLLLRCVRGPPMARRRSPPSGHQCMRIS